MQGFPCVRRGDIGQVHGWPDGDWIKLTDRSGHVLIDGRVIGLGKLVRLRWAAPLAVRRGPLLHVEWKPICNGPVQYTVEV